MNAEDVLVAKGIVSKWKKGEVIDKHQEKKKDQKDHSSNH